MKKIAIIGFGRFGTILFDKFNKHGDIKFVCEKEINRKLLDPKQNFGVAISGNYEEVLDKVDLVVVATPAETHYSIIKKCLQRGKDVFVEKPLANSVSEAKELIEVAEAKKLKLYIDNVFLYRKEFQELKKRIQERKIKKIIFRWRKYGTFNESILNNLVYHDMYMLIDLLGLGDINTLKLVKVKDPLKRGRIDILEFRFNYNGTEIECKYDRTYSGKEKYMEIIIDNENFKWLNNKIVINNKTEEIKEQDALSEAVKDLLNDKVDYTQNHFLALKSLECLQQIKHEFNL